MTFKTIVLLLTASLATTGLACESGSTGTETSTSPESALEALTGTYDFVLASSDVAQKVHAQCIASSGSDATRAAQCWSAAQREAANEKIRFSRNADGQLVFTSFAVDHERRDVFVEVPITETEVEAGIIVASAIGRPHGFKLRVERGPDDTIVLLDPKKGRLVYHRAE